jgi:phosphoribosylanthranilate isomerase
MAHRMKVCGATSAADITLLAAAGADFVGLWHGVPDGRSELSTAEVAELAAVAAGQIEPVLVTLRSRAAVIKRSLSDSGVRWVQLHGYPTPATVHSVKSTSDCSVIKVLHVRESQCVERPLIKSYERAGVDVFLIDMVASDGQVGSTAQQLDPAAAGDLVQRLSVPFMLAGGISADNAEDYAVLREHPLFSGIDVDTNARTGGGRLDGERITAVRKGWAI